MGAQAVAHLRWTYLFSFPVSVLPLTSLHPFLVLVACAVGLLPSTCLAPAPLVLLFSGPVIGALLG